MKKSELKSMIKECVKEVLFEEGVLSNLVAEVAFGITKAQGLVVESKPPQAITQQQQEEIEARETEARRKKLLETKRKMLAAIGGGKMKGVFEGTEPLSTSGSPNEKPSASPLSGLDPKDSGVDISELFSLAGKKWNALK